MEPATAQRIRQARRDAGLSLDRLAELADTSRRHLIRLEKGENTPGRLMLERIAAATGRPLDFFIDGLVPPKKRARSVSPVAERARFPRGRREI